jgi:hypothetical protein
VYGPDVAIESGAAYARIDWAAGYFLLKKALYSLNFAVSRGPHRITAE